MATGDDDDIKTRLMMVMPNWFGADAPIKDALVSGFAKIGSWGYAILQYAKAQTRISTATDFFLDLAAFDFFGMRVKRKTAQPDDVFRDVIRKEVLRERGTRRGMLKALRDLTGTDAVIFEPSYAFDTGGYDTYGLGYDIAGGWGSRNYPNQFFIRVVEPIGAGVPNVAGYDTIYGAFDGGYSSFIDPTDIVGKVTQQDIYDTIEATRTAGVTCWVTIGPPLPKPAQLGIDFVLGTSALASSTMLSGVKVAPENEIGGGRVGIDFILGATPLS